MAQGTGLPLPNPNRVLLRPQEVIPASEAATNAQTWKAMAGVGQTLTDAGVDWATRAQHQARVGYAADYEVKDARQRTDMQAKFQYDPAGFDNAWKAYSDGVLSETEPWAVPYRKVSLGQQGNGAYASLLNEKRGQDRRLAGDSMESLVNLADNDVLGAASAGTFYTETGQAKLDKYKAVLASAVTAGFISEDKANERILNITGRIGAETSKSWIKDAYLYNRARGADAANIAYKQAEDMFLKNDDPALAGLDQRQRDAYYNAATGEIRALEGERKIDLRYARESAKELQQLLLVGPVSPDVIDSVSEQLIAAGGQADAARLRAAAIRQPTLVNYGRLSLSEATQVYQDTRASMGLPANRDEIATSIKQSANELGVDPVALATAISYETGGTFSPDVMGGKGGKYQGYIQFSPANQQVYGITKGMTPAQQMQAVTKYLKAAGVKPGMGLLDIYSAINAGAVGRYGASDKPGETVASHVARMEREHGPKAAALLGGVSGAVDFELIKGERDLLKGKAKDEWTKVKQQLEDDTRPDPETLDIVYRAATLAGDTETLEEMATRLDRFDAVQISGRVPLEVQQGAISELEGQPSLTPGQNAYLQDLKKVSTTIEKALNEDAISLAPAWFPERYGALPEIDLSPEQAPAHMQERERRAAFVAETWKKPDISILSKADATKIATAIATPNLPPEEQNQPEVAPDKSAFDFLAAVPDQYLTPTLKTKEVNEAISGAVRSKEPGKFGAAMAFVNQIWSRAPQEAENLFKGDIISTMQDWQAKLRYYSQQELADYLRSSDDPQVVQRRHEAAVAGQKLALVKDIDGLVAALDPGWFTTGPAVPVDPRTRDAALADYTMIFSDRYAISLDADTAHQQAIERMRLYWGRSEVNNGRLTLYAPETVYPALSGSHDWLKEQLDADLTKQFGKLPDDYAIVADRTTEAEIGQGQAPSYLIVVKNDKGEFDLVRTGSQQKPMRYRWEAGAVLHDARADFERQRAKVFRPDEMAFEPHGTRFDPITGQLGLH